MKYAVTAASGQLGRKVVGDLLSYVPARDVVAIARTPDNLEDFAHAGVTVRAGDDDDDQALWAALESVAVSLPIRGTIMNIWQPLFACLFLFLTTAAGAQEAGDTPETTKLKARSKELGEDVIKVTDGVYTAVGYSPANSSMVVGTDGVIIIDTAMTPAHAKAIWKEFRELTDKPLKAVIYTHGHGDHMNGTKVFVGKEEVEIWARTGFGAEDAAFSTSGVTINKARGARQGGFRLPDELRINNGIAPALRPEKGTNPFAAEASGFLPPNRTFSESRKRLTLAGVSVELVAAPGESSDQLYVWLPEKKVLFSGDNFYRSWPNLYAIRGTPYRDVRAWADSVDRMVKEGPDHLVPGHTRPFSGRDSIQTVLRDYRDAIRFVFDKTVEGMNKGLTPDELVQYVQLPNRLAQKDYLIEYYGNVEWGVRSIFAGHLGWFDGNPTHLFSLAPKEEARRIAGLAGGPGSLLKQAQKAVSSQDHQWAAQLSDYLLALDPNDSEAKKVKAKALSGLAVNLLTATGRNYYLTVAQELLQSTDTIDSKPAVEPTYKVVLTPEVRFDQLNPARGDQSPEAGTIWGDRNGRGPTGFLFKPVDGFESPPHIHNVSYRGVVIRGLIHNDDPKADKMWMPKGSFWTQPKGGVHITAAKGSDALAYIEIDEGPYLVQPVEEEFRSEEKPLNVHASNIVWVDQPETRDSADGPQMAFLWGNPKEDQLNGTLVRLPAGFTGTMRSHGAALRAVVIQGRPKHRVPGETGARTLGPGSYFSSTGESAHRLSCEAAEGCIVYVRTTGNFDVIPVQPGK